MQYYISALVLVGVLSIGMTSLAQAEEGKKLFQKKMCVACHGPGKNGGDLKDSKMDKAAMTKFLKDPKAANPKASGMQTFKGSDTELTALVDYVMSLRK